MSGQRPGDAGRAGGSFNGRTATEDRLEMRRGNVPGTQHDWFATRAIDNGGFDANFARPAIENQRHAVAEFFANVIGRSRADTAKTVGRWCCDASMLAGNGGKGAQQIQRNGMSGHTQTNRILTAGDRIRHPCLLLRISVKGPGQKVSISSQATSGTCSAQWSTASWPAIWTISG
jgi:hypothetical protein